MLRTIRYSLVGALAGLLGAAACDDERLAPTTSGGSQLPPVGGEGGAGHMGLITLPNGGAGANCWGNAECEAEFDCLAGSCERPKVTFEPTGKECQVVQCVEDDDCCSATPYDPLFCADLKLKCDDGDKGACNERSFNCVCDAATKCEDYACTFVETCDTSADCSFVGHPAMDGVCDPSTHRCVGCVTTDDCVENGYYGPGFSCTADQRCEAPQCSADEDCPFADQKCVDEECVDTRECYDDVDCGAFRQCDDDSGKCVERTCTSDRFCAALTNNPNATCVDAACVEPCETPWACNFGPDWGWTSKVCVEGTCQQIGCETHAECDVANDSGLPYACLKPGEAPTLL